MKIAILSDIHGNSAALKAVIDDLKNQEIEKLFILGDLVGYYYHPDEVLDILQEWKKEMIKGNHEKMLEIALANPLEIENIRKKYGSGIRFAIEKLSREEINELINLPETKLFEIDGLKIKIAHGTPWDIEEYIYPDSSKEIIEKCIEKDIDFVFLGHSHYPFVYEKNEKIVANPGSVGQARKKSGVAEYGILDTLQKKFELKQSPYDNSALADEAKKIDSDIHYLQDVLLRKTLYNSILVTGCGGDIGQSVGKILKLERISKKVVGCDLHKEHAGIFIFDECYAVPRANSEDYLNKIKNIIENEKIDVIIPMSEAELRFFNKNKIRNINGAALLMPNFEAMEIGFDKLKTAEFLKENRLPYPWTINVKDDEPRELPCIIKSRFGSGKKGFDIVNNENLDYFKKAKQDFIFQEMLAENEEYTCGVYRSKDKETRTIIFKRRLLGGFTDFGEVVENNEIEELLRKIAEKLNLFGSINIQLRLTEKGPVVFEINPRFSSTVLFRHLIGFKDVVWQLKENLGIKIEKYNPDNKGIKIYKGFSEYVLFNNGDIKKS